MQLTQKRSILPSTPPTLREGRGVSNDSRRNWTMKKQLGRLLALALCSLLTMGIMSFTSNADAQRRGGDKVIRLKDVKIVGRIQKPEAFYVLHRAPLNYKSLQIKESFVKKVINAVKKSPF